MRLLLTTGRRDVGRHPWQAGLAALGVAIAVAVVAGVDLANSSATEAFRLSVEGVAGEATHEIVGSRGVENGLYARLRGAGVRRVAPVVEGLVAHDDVPGRPLRLFGVDPLADVSLRAFARGLGAGADAGAGGLERFLTLPGAVLLSPELAADLGLEPGESFEIDYGGGRHRLTLVGLHAASDELARRAGRDLLVTDVASAQEILGRLDRLSRIDAVVEPGEEGALAALLPPGYELRAKAARAGALAGMTRAFRLNLDALSLLALLVGMFLIYNTMSFRVVERRATIGTLRALGVTRREVFGLVLSEAAILGLLGSAAGLALGVALAQGLVQLVAGTINDLYFALTVESVRPAPASLAKGLALGLGGTVVSALWPAWEATAAPPRAVLARSQLERRTRHALPRLAGAGLLLGLLAAALLAVDSKSLVLSFAAIFVFVLGFACLVPPLTLLASRALRPPLARLLGILGTMAARGVGAALSRTGVATAALVIAVAMTIGVGIMVRSFRATLVDWLETTLQADVYVAPADAGRRGAPRDLGPRLVERLLAVEGVAEVATYRRVEAGSPTGPVQLLTLGAGEQGFAIFRFTGGDRGEIERRFRAGEAIVSEPYAYRHEIEPGDELELRTDRGPRRFRVAGVYYDYGSDRGTVTLARGVYERFWDDRGVSSLAFYAAPGVEPEALAAALRRVAGDQPLTVAPNRELRRSALVIFDRTFRITGVLRLLALGVAFVGILSALMALQLERRREIGVLRSQGATPRQVWGLVLTETGILGLWAGVLSLPLGVALAALLVHVVNRRSFGWTLRFEVDPALLAQALALALAAALLAGLYPAWRMARVSPARALREE